MKKQNGITLIALVITIIVMLILVGVSVTVALNGGLFATAKEAANETKTERDKEMALSNGTVKIGEKTYNSIDEYVKDNCSHEWGEWEETKAANYTETGEKERTCIKCGTVQTESIAKLVCSEHTFTNGECSVCGYECTNHSFVNDECTNCGIKRITFSIRLQSGATNTYKAYEGMTWREWVENSELNSGGYCINPYNRYEISREVDGYNSWIIGPNGNKLVDEIIVDNYTYEMI